MKLRGKHGRENAHDGERLNKGMTVRRSAPGLQDR
jgi:hypothetical protein